MFECGRSPSRSQSFNDLTILLSKYIKLIYNYPLLLTFIHAFSHFREESRGRSPSRSQSFNDLTIQTERLLSYTMAVTLQHHDRCSPTPLLLLSNTMTLTLYHNDRYSGRAGVLYGETASPRPPPQGTNITKELNEIV
jgi:hypothetical protein